MTVLSRSEIGKKKPISQHHITVAPTGRLGLEVREEMRGDARCVSRPGLHHLRDSTGAPGLAPWSRPVITAASGAETSSLACQQRLRQPRGRKAPFGRAVSPQTDSQWLRSQHPARCCRTHLGTGAAGNVQTAAVLLGERAVPKFTPSMATCRLVTWEGGSLSCSQVPGHPARQDCCARRAGSHQHPPHLRRAAHLCAETRRCSRRWTSARRPGRAAG